VPSAGCSTLSFVPVVVDLAGRLEAVNAYRDGVARGALPALPVWASEAIDLINDLPCAAHLVSALAAQAEEALARAGGR
jgi:nitronate monooxygenase